MALTEKEELELLELEEQEYQESLAKNKTPEAPAPEEKSLFTKAREGFNAINEGMLQELPIVGPFYDEMTGAQEAIKTAIKERTLDKQRLNQAYEEGRDQKRASLKQNDKDHPVLSTLGKGVGIATGMVGGGAALKGVSKLPNVLSRVSGAGLVGAGTGIVDAYGRNTNPDTLNEEIESGGKVGGALGSIGQFGGEVIKEAAPKIGKMFSRNPEVLEEQINLGKQGIDTNDSNYLNSKIKELGNAGDKYSNVINDLQKKYGNQYNEIIKKYGPESVELKAFVKETADDLNKMALNADVIEERQSLEKLAKSFSEDLDLPSMNKPADLSKMRNYELKKKEGLSAGEDKSRFVEKVKQDLSKKIAEKTRSSLPEEGQKLIEDLDKNYSGVKDIKRDHFKATDNELESKFVNQVKGYFGNSIDARVGAQKGIDDLIAGLKKADPINAAKYENEILSLSKQYQAGKISEAKFMEKIMPYNDQFHQILNNKLANPNSSLNKLPRSLQLELIKRINDKKASKNERQ